MTRVLWPLLALSLLIPMPSPAQDSEAEVRTEATSDSPILRAMLLPLLAQEARAAGMPEEDLLLLLTESQRHQIPAERAGELLEESTKALRENGPVDNFGAFVQAQLAAGLRGRELADAIHVEHRTRGKDAVKKPKPVGGKGEKKGAER